MFAEGATHVCDRLQTDKSEDIPAARAGTGKCVKV